MQRIASPNTRQWGKCRATVWSRSTHSRTPTFTMQDMFLHNLQILGLQLHVRLLLEGPARILLRLPRSEGGAVRERGRRGRDRWRGPQREREDGRGGVLLVGTRVSVAREKEEERERGRPE